MSNVAFLPLYLEKIHLLLHFTAEADAKMLLLSLFSMNVVLSAAADVAGLVVTPSIVVLAGFPRFLFFLRPFTFDTAHTCWRLIEGENRGFFFLLVRFDCHFY